MTLTTVGYGDIAPKTALGQTLASLLMILGYGILAVPTGIVSVELARAQRSSRARCPGCGREGHDRDAVHCKHCGTALGSAPGPGKGAAMRAFRFRLPPAREPGPAAARYPR